MKKIKLTILNIDAFQVEADVLVMKYAQQPYGMDREIVNRLVNYIPDIAAQLPKNAQFYLEDSFQITTAPQLLFVGVPKARNFSYKAIREFGRNVLSSLNAQTIPTKKVAMTIHGVGFGLDEIEAFESQIAGLVDSIKEDDYPEDLEEIIFVEKSEKRAKRLESFLTSIFPDKWIPTKDTGGVEKLEEDTSELLRAAGYDSESKKKIFVAMPFTDEFIDVFHFGIQGAAHDAGFLCERADLEFFTGDVVQWIRDRIEKAALVIADLTGANANVYLEVGYAWGKNKKTILLIDKIESLKFDVRGQRCIAYKNIKELKEKLTIELDNVVAHFDEE